MFEDLSGKCALVTGASSGLGAHFARLLAGRGVHVVLGARRREALQQLRDEIIGNAGKADIVTLDVSSKASVDAAFNELPAPLDIVVNNAGISGSATAMELSEGEWDSVIDTNLKGVFMVAQAAARHMRERSRGGAIVNIASIIGFRTAGSLSAYAASKAGAIHLTRSLALEWARFGIRVNALCPGYIETDINRDFFATPAGEAMVRRIPMRRLGKAGELDGALLLLASDAGSYITGASLAADGGHLVSSL
ncbi:SDR family oxidoreductase [Mesorhizobium microcysteis]|uniref:SDR family oxidoreductase n=1 Tax=Neoaquamicrobium microcysteis TaxID=2682781 RepID=A0A5D4GQA8_9HYPH|nr:SDR family NAD(P)-dependent oxidoreductase [Mesorhizobium microcysteis]TYR30547.1 SDR family oxidoreductase [Mesorhizobium microcysteis]